MRRLCDAGINGPDSTAPAGAAAASRCAPSPAGYKKGTNHKATMPFSWPAKWRSLSRRLQRVCAVDDRGLLEAELNLANYPAHP